MAEKILIIVESPNKVQTIRSFLPENYKVMASVGHICEIVNGGSYWNTGIDPKNNFETDFQVSQDKKVIVNQLKEEVKKADKVLLATDPDREGEAIAWFLKKFLKIPNNKCERITYTEVTKSAILEAINNPRKIDENLVHSSLARRKLDRLLGFRMSALARKRLKAKSVGRCQSSGLKLVVDREDEIQNFVPEQYAELFLEFKIDEECFKAKYISQNRLSRKEAEDIVEDCKVLYRNDKFTITDVESTEKFSYSKPPFITSTFQQEVSSKLGISVKKTMDIAQKLFEGIEINGQHVGLITYIRTDSTEMSEEFKTKLRHFVIDMFGNKYYAPVKEGKKDELSQEGHECLRVTDLSMTSDKLARYVEDKNLIKVYDLIYRRTVASSMSPTVTGETTYTISLGKHKFKLVSKELIFDGYKKVYNFKEKDDSDKLYKHTFSRGEIIQHPNLMVEDKETQPKPRFKESTLLKELESSGIGRPSTYATIVSTILDDSRGYCTEEKNIIIPTELGSELTHFLDKHFSDLINLNYTREMEEELDKIAKGQLDEVEFLTSFYNKMEASIKRYFEETGESSKPKSKPVISSQKCPNCGKPMAVRKGPFGEFLGCTGYPNCRTIINIEEKK